MDVKKIARSVSGCIHRGVQRTEEKLSQHTIVTPIPEEIARKIRNLNNTAVRTANIVKYVEKVVKPFRDQSKDFYVYDISPVCMPVERSNPLLELGIQLADLTRTALDDESDFEKVLPSVAKCEEELGREELKFVDEVAQCVLRPLRDFLRNDLMQATLEKRNLHNRRLDLDSSKNRLKKAKTSEQIATAETAVRIAQVEFDRQMEMTRIVLDGVERAQSQHATLLTQFVNAQFQCHRQSLEILDKHKNQLTSLSF